jgi:hypothetical protein
MDDWQDAAFSSRHLHNRIHGSGKSKRNNVFDVRKTFGTYSIKCAAWRKIQTAPESEEAASLETYRLTEDGKGVVGELHLPGVLHGAIILAASRASLRRTITDIESSVLPDEYAADDNDELLEYSSRSSGTEADEPKLDRFKTFEKNSFRSPKFWFQWNGVPLVDGLNPHEGANTIENGLGYIVFNNNNCRKFEGTINCKSLEWEDVSITGCKIRSRPESDTIVNWKL